MGSNTQPVTQTTKVELSPEQRQLYDLAMPSLQQWAANPPQLPDFSSVADFDPAQTAGQNLALGSVGDVASTVGSAGEANRFLTSGAVLSPESNPYLKSSIDAATRPIYEGLTEKALPAIRGTGIQAGGGYSGSTRQGIAEGIASREASRAAGDTAAKMASTNYQTGLDALVKGLALAPSTATSATLPGQITSGVGDVRQAQLQRLIDEMSGRWSYQQNLPLMVGQELIGTAGAIPAAGATTTASGPQQNKALSALGGAASGAALGSSLFPGVGTAAGAGLGALLAFL